MSLCVVCVCAYVRACMRACAYVHACVRVCVHAGMRVRVRAYVLFVCAYVRAVMRERIRGCLCLNLRAVTKPDVRV